MKLVPTANLVLGLVTALIVMSLWAGIATYKFIQLKATAPLKCDNEQLSENLKGVEAALGTMSTQVKEAAEFSGIELGKTNKTLAGIGKAFTPIEEALHEAPVVVPAACTGTFPDGVRRALDQAAAEANR